MVQVRNTHKAQSAIAGVLRYGSSFSAGVMGFGVLLSLLPGRDVSTTAHFPPDQIVAKALQFDPMGVAELGIFFLLLTPVLRVAIAVVGFGLERDHKYAMISLGVLFVLLASIAYSLG